MKTATAAQVIATGDLFKLIRKLDIPIHRRGQRFIVERKRASGTSYNPTLYQMGFR